MERLPAARREEFRGGDRRRQDEWSRRGSAARQDGLPHSHQRGRIFRDGNGLCGGMFGGAAVFERRHWRRGGIAFRGAV
jgi:hypothetical protein